MTYAFIQYVESILLVELISYIVHITFLLEFFSNCGFLNVEHIRGVKLISHIVHIYIFNMRKSCSTCNFLNVWIFKCGTY